MRKIFLLTILIFVLNFTFPTLTFSQGTIGSIMDGNGTVAQSDSGHTTREEAEGKEIWEKFQSKELACEDLPDENFEALGMYFMGLMTGEYHEKIDVMMIRMMGEDGEKQMHIAMGKRLSDCDPNAPMPQNMMGGGMMQMMMGGRSSPFGFNTNNSIMNFGFMTFGWVFMILFWGLVIIGIIALVKWLANQGKRNQVKSKSALDILKERYAKGEISKEEFEEKRKDLA